MTPPVWWPRNPDAVWPEDDYDDELDGDPDDETDYVIEPPYDGDPDEIDWEDPSGDKEKSMADREARIAALQEQINRLAATPDDVFNDGDVLTFAKTYNPVLVRRDAYVFAAMKVNGQWYMTGRQSSPLSWDQLIEFIGDNLDTVHVATGWRPISKENA